MAICCNLGKSLFHCFAFQPTTFQKHTSPFCSSYQARCSGSLQILQYYLMTGQENEYVRYLVLCQGLSHLASPVKEQLFSFLFRLIFHPVHLTMPHLQHQKDIYLEFNKKIIFIQME